MRNFLFFLTFPFLSGALTYLSFERFSLFPLAWISLSIPIYILISKKRYPFLIGFSWAFSFYTISLYWLVNVMSNYGNLSLFLSIIFFLILVIALSSLFGLIFFSINSVINSFPSLEFITPPLFWVSLEYILTFLLTGFPWNLMGYSQIHFIPIIQLSSITGVYGISFLIIFFNSSIAKSLKSRDFKWLIPSLILFIICLFYGIYLIDKGFKKEGSLRIAVVQGNTSMDDELFRNANLLEKKFLDYLEMTKKAINQNARLVIWPETSVPILFRYDIRKGIIFELSRNTNTFILASFTDWREGKFYNSVFLISPSNSISSVYDKIHLVPFGEYVPFKKIFGFFESITKEVGDYTPGSQIVLHSIDKIKFGSPICYEIIFPYMVRRFVKEGAQFLVTVSNDGWFGRSDAPYQHFSIASMRCVENRRYLLRATSTGVSGIVDPFGRVLKKIDLGKMEFAIEDIYPINEKTFYSKYGDILAKSCLTISSILFILSLWRKNKWN